MDLIQKALEALGHAYAPYSKFKVGAVIVGGSGKSYVGCNVENSSYGVSICAERSALTNAVVNGESEIKTIAVVSSSNSPVVPCGLCLQALSEFGPHAEVICSSFDQKSVKKYQMKDLLPHVFDKSSLKT